ncbi:hypothetical protein GQ600_7702 [Phytophthora cactorum]|nr:hypothetical protein GQ600_7702 [Phytophthora cactorum]
MALCRHGPTITSPTKPHLTPTLAQTQFLRDPLCWTKSACLSMQKPALIVSRYVSAALKRNVMPQTTRNIIANLVKNDPAEVNLHQLFNKFCV